MQVLALRSKHSSGMDRAHLAGFLLLLLWPDLGKQMSFQLSMTAVMAIIFIQSPHGKTIQSKIVGISMVSLAAQWATLPLIAMTFHRFPWGFLFANLLLLPLVMLIYPLVALSVALSWFSLALPVPDSVMDAAFRLINAFHYTTDGMHPDAWLVAIMGLAAMLGLQALKARRLLPLVLPLMALRKFSGSVESTKCALMPSFASVLENKLYVPPYKLEEETISSPAPAMFRTENVIAACPEDVASAPAPPSSAAIRFSNTSVVGFIIRV